MKRPNINTAFLKEAGLFVLGYMTVAAAIMSLHLYRATQSVARYPETPHQTSVNNRFEQDILHVIKQNGDSDNFACLKLFNSYSRFSWEAAKQCEQGPHYFPAYEKANGDKTKHGIHGSIPKDFDQNNIAQSFYKVYGLPPSVFHFAIVAHESAHYFDHKRHENNLNTISDNNPHTHNDTETRAIIFSILAVHAYYPEYGLIFEDAVLTQANTGLRGGEIDHTAISIMFPAAYRELIKKKDIQSLIQLTEHIFEMKNDSDWSSKATEEDRPYYYLANAIREGFVDPRDYPRTACSSKKEWAGTLMCLKQDFLEAQEAKVFGDNSQSCHYNPDRMSVTLRPNPVMSIKIRTTAHP